MSVVILVELFADSGDRSLRILRNIAAGDEHSDLSLKDQTGGPLAYSFSPGLEILFHQVGGLRINIVKNHE